MGLSSVAERRKKIVYWDVPLDFSTILLEPTGKPYKTHVDEETHEYYVIDDDGERTYIVFG